MYPIVYVITMPELGWDCVVGVFNNLETAKEELELTEEDLSGEGQYCIFEQALK